MELELATAAFVTLFVIIDPIGLTPLFIALTSGMTKRQRRGVGIRALATGAGILIVFGLTGEFLLAKVGISMSAFRISGGILLFLTAIDMLFERRTQRREKTAEEDEGPDPAVFPLAMPLIAGPGAMTSMILLIGQQSGDLTGQMLIYGVLFGVLFIVFLLFMMADLMEKVLGHTGINLVTRLMGMFLAALSVQFVLDGLREFGLFGL